LQGPLYRHGRPCRAPDRLNARLICAPFLEKCGLVAVFRSLTLSFARTFSIDLRQSQRPASVGTPDSQISTCNLLRCLLLRSESQPPLGSPHRCYFFSGAARTSQRPMQRLLPQPRPRPQPALLPHRHRRQHQHRSPNRSRHRTTSTR
jgi:hypothetical protein